MESKTIKVDISGNIIVQDEKDSFININTKDANDVLEKLKQLNNQQVGVLQQVIKEHKNMFSELFSTLVDGASAIKNVVYGDITANSVRIGDEIHYHFHPKQEILSKKITISIPTLSPESIIGRQKDLHKVRQLLLDKKEAILLNGFGAIGKTTLAQVYTYQFWDEYEHIVWITQKSRGAFLLDFINTEGLKENLKISKKISNPEDIFYAIINKLNSIVKQPSLIVLDNIDESIEKYRNNLPSSPRWHVLLTSREELDGFLIQRLDFLNKADAFRLFKKYYLLRDLSGKQIKELVAKVGCHTLTIELLAKTANHQRYAFQTLKDALRFDLEADIKVGRLENDMRIGKVTSFLCSVFLLSQLDVDETWLLQQMVCLPSEYHTYNLLLKLINPPPNNKLKIFSPTLNNLCQKGWLIKNVVSDSFKMHQVITEVIKKEKCPEIRQVNRLVRNISNLLADNKMIDNPIEKFQWIPFGKTILSIIEMGHKSQEEEHKISILQNNLSLVLRDYGDYNSAKKIIDKAIQTEEIILGKEHPTTAISYSNLALILQNLGDYEQAKNIFERVVKIKEKVYGYKHSKTAISYSNLGTAHLDLGNLNKAKRYINRALISDLENFGEKHPFVARDYSNLASILQSQEDYKGAKKLLLIAIKSDVKNFGNDHPTTIGRYSNLAIVLYELDDYGEATDLMERVIKFNEENFGEKHPFTAKSYSNLGTILHSKGDCVRAKKLLEKAIEIDENIFGKEHPLTAIHYSNLALIFVDLRDYTQALELSEKTLSIFQNTLPQDHPNLIQAKNIYSNIKQKTKNYGTN